MKHNYLLFSYHLLLEKYRKYFSRLQRHLRKGTFAGLSASRKNFLVHKVEELRARLLALHPKLTGTVAAASLASMLCLSEAGAQPFVYNTQKNPFSNSSFPIQNRYPDTSPAVKDLDGDGDEDVLVVYDQTFYYYKNTGTPSAPAFTQQTGTNNPMGGFKAILNWSSLDLADMDGDGDFDLLVGGEFYGKGMIISYYKNTGTATSPAFTLQTGTNNPLPACSGYVGYGSPAAVDIDGDGDNDVFLADGYFGKVYFFKNIGTNTSPTFVQTTSGNPFPTGDVTPTGAYYLLFPAFADIDGDGDQDALLGQREKEIIWYKNTGTPTAAVMTLVTGTSNPLSGFTGHWQPLSFADMDHDGTQDLILGSNYAVTSIYFNAGTATAPEFSPMNFGTHTKLSFADIDGNGDLDAVFSDDITPPLPYLVNNGPATQPVFTMVAVTSSPFYHIRSRLSNAFADLDGDMDLDLMIGYHNGTFIYFQNTGTSKAAIYARQTGTNNPVNGLSNGNYYSTPALVDIDGDGDQDLVSGAKNGTISYFQNTGTKTAAVFTQQTGTNNPFNGVTSDYYNYLCFVNFDGDGDMDLLIGTESSGLFYYQNTGTATSPTFTAMTGTNSPFDFINTNYTTTNMYYGPAFMDIDGDGDLDLFVAQRDGAVKLYVNQAPVTITAISSPQSSSFSNNIEAYPNPVKDVLNFLLNDAIGSTMQVSVLDMTGMEMLNESMMNTGSAMNLNVSSLNTGMYMLRLSSDSKVTTLKFVKQ